MLLLMFPTHAAIGYIAGRVTQFSVAFFLLGSILPDIIDRPLSWIGLTGHAHTIGHSVLLAVPFATIAIVFLDARAIAVGLGWLGHLAGDLVNVATTAGPANAPTFILYPLVDPVGGQSFATVAFSPPLLGTPHIVHPVVLVAEIGLLGGALLSVSGREWWRYARLDILE